MKRFGEDICPHFLGGTETKVKFTRIVIMADIEILRLDVLSSFGARNITIFGKREGAHVVLEHNIGGDRVTLSFEEMSGPEDVACFVVETNEFAFC